MVALFRRNLSGPRKRNVLRCPKGFHGGSFPQKLFWAPVAGPPDTGVCVLSEKGGCPKGFHGDPFAQKLIWVAKTLCIAMSQKWLFSTGTFLGPRCPAISHWRLRAFRKGGGGCPEGNVSGRSRFRLAPAPGGISPMRPRPLGAQIPHCFIGFSSCARPGRCIRHSD